MAYTPYHPAFQGVVQAEESYVPEDADGQVSGVVGMMRRYVLEHATSEQIARAAREAVGEDPAGVSQSEIARRVFRYVKSQVSFVEDENLVGTTGLDSSSSPVVEVLIRPRKMAVMCSGSGCRRVGDCEDFSMYTAALLTALGVESSFVTIAADPREPERFSHVYVAAYPRDWERIPLDVSHGPRPGWESPQAYRKQEWPLSGAVDAKALAALAVWKEV